MLAACGYMREDGVFTPPKYFTEPAFDKGRALYNFDAARTSRVAVLVEGTLDAAGVGPCAVAALGKNITDTQMKLLCMHWSAVVLLLDPGDGDRQSDQVARTVSRAVPVLPVRLQGYKDPGDAPPREVWRQILDRAAAARFPLQLDVQHLGANQIEYLRSTAWRT
jgi:DNA primase